ncbi:MAG: hypothetical protein KKH68_07750, partial [Proteobacteria bacterium]|nr:hypothetical protein [Pseudomonadota bacterium]
KPQDFAKQSQKHFPADASRRLFLPVPYYPVNMLKQKNLFTEALQRIDISEVLEQVQTEFAGLCNQVIAANQKPIRDREALKEIVKKICGYLNIGLERLTAKDQTLDRNQAAWLVHKYPLSSLFRVGYGLALDLKWRAEKWRKTSWFERQGLLLSFWDETGMGTLGGLLLKKPLYFDNYESGMLYREFLSFNDIKKTEDTLHEIIATDELLSLISAEPEPVIEGLLTYKNFMLTLWARDYLGLSPGPSPLTLNEFMQFFNDLWSGKTSPRKTSRAIKASFLNWLTNRSRLVPNEISAKLGPMLESLFAEIESEYGQVAVKDLDPRYIHLFLITLTER